MKNDGELRQLLYRIDGRGYKAYKEIRGEYQFPEFTLFIDYVQGDPFASPSRLRVRVPQTVAQYPTHTFQNQSRRVGLENYLLAVFDLAAREVAGRKGSGKSGLIAIDVTGQAMLARTAMRVNSNFVEAQFAVGLPAQGRRVLGRSAAGMLCDDLPRIVETALQYKNNRADLIAQYTAVSEDADSLRNQLANLGMVAFVANGAVLPRRSGVDERPLRGDSVVKWQSPLELGLSFDLPNAGKITGTGIPAGVTLIVGGGFHGKSTLLNALEQGIYNHKPGDGREFVVAHPDAVKIRAEDGRRVAGVDISPFINNLPFGHDTTAFSSDNASGSTSQAANIMEAVALGSSLLLIDEDTAATNFMIRDRRMQALVAKSHEPITPFIDRVRQLYVEHGVSTVLVIGGSGDYFDVADRVIMMNVYRPQDVTIEAQNLASLHPTNRQPEGGTQFGKINGRIPQPRSINARKGRRDVSIKTRGVHTIQFGMETIELSAVSQLIDSSQTRAIADAIQYARDRYMDGKRPLREVLDLMMADVAARGLRVINGRSGNDYAAFRKYELGAALNRLRSLKVRPKHR
ncbi:MAG: ABC-ATPase domain-containing protein [Chloroflexi bacterium]|nr:ABC-ATPase domain-containing protein [Chloroflexota bacterium]